MKPEKSDSWKVGISPHHDRTDGGNPIGWEVVAIGAIVLATVVNAVWIVTSM